MAIDRRDMFSCNLNFLVSALRTLEKITKLNIVQRSSFTHMHECKLTVPYKMLQSSLQHIATYQIDQDAEVQGQSDLVYYLLQL